MTAAPAPGWVTNSPEAAAKLKAADRAYDQAKAAARGLRLAVMIVALRTAKATRDAAYQAVFDAAGKEETP